eukprot:TRINITY_DN49269_c0_g1_i1.p1 TRINITY_DN49269_c0_g1~~TRINITY_DN49269_c0_g1_i1.p1  ORF type:complete len:616 (+),score=82.76 TRINITY_DN49269_c0_g1_i1:164-1849(+)
MPSLAGMGTTNALTVQPYPRIRSAWDILQDDSDSDCSVFCACGSVDSEDADVLATFLRWNLDGGGKKILKTETQVTTALSDPARHDASASWAQRCLESSALILPKGKLGTPGTMKYICTIHIGIDDPTDEFCLVKRILGKGGSNMRFLASDSNARIRLRGIGSGFLEGDSLKEANMPLRLDVSCTTYDDYCFVVERLVSQLLLLHAHYRRFLRSIGGELTSAGKVQVDELRRDDIGFDLLDHHHNTFRDDKFVEKSVGRDARLTADTVSSGLAALGRAPVQTPQRPPRVSKALRRTPPLATAQASRTAGCSGPGSVACVGACALERATTEQRRRAAESSLSEGVFSAGKARQEQQEPTRTQPCSGKQRPLLRSGFSIGHNPDGSDTSMVPDVARAAKSKVDETFTPQLLPPITRKQRQTLTLRLGESELVPQSSNVSVPPEVQPVTPEDLGPLSDQQTAEYALALEVIETLQIAPTTLSALGAYRYLGSRYVCLVEDVSGIQQLRPRKPWANWLLSIPGVNIARNFSTDGSFLPTCIVSYTAQSCGRPSLLSDGVNPAGLI